MSNNSDAPKLTPAFITLPKVGLPRKEGEDWQVEQIEIATLTKAKIKPYLVSFNLARSGNRPEMLARLVEYANDQRKWTNQFYAAPSRVRGRMAGSRGKTIMAKRIQEKFGDIEPGPALEYQSKRAPHDVKDTRGPNYKSEAIKWATEVLTRTSLSPVTLKATDGQVNSCNIDDSTGVDRTKTAQATQRADHEVVPSRCLSDQVAQLDLKVDQLLTSTHLQNSANEPAYRCLSGHQTTDRTQDPYLPDSQDHDMLDVPEPEHETLDSFKMTSGITVTYSGPLPNIPAISFKNNVDQLFVDWYSSHHLVLGDQAVAIQDWDRVYKKTAGWKMFKSTYCNFKSIIHEFEACGHSREQFWEHHRSQDGNKLGYYQLVTRLRQKRKDGTVSDEVLVDRVRQYYGGDITQAPRQVFMYRKRGKWHEKTRAASIANAWRELLAEENNLAESWEAWEADNAHDQQQS